MEGGKKKSDLLFKDLPVGKKFRPLEYPITKELVEDFMETVGDRHQLYNEASTALPSPIAPPGLAAIYARLSYLQDHTMPSGGVLIKQEFEFVGPSKVGDVLQVTAEVAESYIDKKDRNRIAFHIKTETRENEPVSTVRLYLIWPK